MIEFGQKGPMFQAKLVYLDFLDCFSFEKCRGRPKPFGSTIALGKNSKRGLFKIFFLQIYIYIYISRTPF